MIVSEYALDFDREEDGKKIYVQALTEFQQLLEEKDLKLHFPVDLRFASNESSWLSPAYEQRCFYIGMCVREYSSPQIPAIMQAFFDLMEKFGARPHWGKLFDSKINLKKCFPKLEDFLKVKTKLDPHNLLTNKHFQVWFA
jgi:L-gulonolactone oxidase